MADIYTDFAPVTTGANDTIKNGLPLKNAVTAFQYRKRLNSFFPFSGIDTGGGLGFKNVSGNFKIRVWERADNQGVPTGRVLFEQEITIRFQITVSSLAGGIGFFFWSPLDSADAYLRETTICDGKPVPVDSNGHHEGWKFVDTPRQTQFSEQGDVRAGDFDDVTDDLTATSTFTLAGGYIDATFQSARYNCDLPQGAVLEVVFDRWQFASLREATYSFAFKGVARLAAIWDRVGAFRTARPFRAGTILEHRFPGMASVYSVPKRRSFFEGLNNARILKTRDNALWLLANEATEGRLYLSEDDGTSKRRATRKIDGVEEEILVFGSGFQIIDFKEAPDGTQWGLASKDDVLFLASSRDDWIASKALGRAKEPPYAMGISRDGTILVASATHEYEYDGQTIIERPAPTPTTPVET